MKKSLTIILLLLAATAATTAYSQDTITYYYTAEWKKATVNDSWTYYRKAYKENGQWIANDYYKSGKLQMTGTYKSILTEQKHGLFTYYYENGCKKAEGLFNRNIIDGEWKEWDDRGNLKVINTFAFNLIVDQKIYYENGTLQLHATFRNGREHGHWQYFDYNGLLIYEGNFSNGKKQGLWTRYFPDSPAMTQTFVRGKLRENMGLGMVIED